MYAFTSQISKAIVLGILVTPAWAQTAEQPVAESNVAAPAYAQNSDATGVVAQQDDATISFDAIHIVATNAATASSLVGTHHGLIPHVSDAVRGEVSNLLLTGTVDEMMELIAKTANVDWFVYSGTLEISASSEAHTRFIPLDGLSIEGVERILAEAEIDLARVGLVHLPDGNAVRLSGPPKALEIVEALLSLAEEQKPILRTDAVVVRRGTVKSVEIYGQEAIAQLSESPAPTQVVEEETPTETKPEDDQTSDDES